MDRIIKRVDFPKIMQPQALKVCAYTRVSSGKNAMLHSLSAQISHYSEMIQSHIDILNKVGLIPFVIAVIFTITSIRSAYGAAVRMKKANHNLLSNQIASLGLGALLICMPEPVVDANPYFFFAILMLLGGIKGVECSFGKEDTAESERGF